MCTGVLLPEGATQPACAATGLHTPAQGCLTLHECPVQLCMCTASWLCPTCCFLLLIKKKKNLSPLSFSLQTQGGQGGSNVASLHAGNGVFRSTFVGILVGPDASILTNWLWSFLNAGIQVCCSISHSERRRALTVGCSPCLARGRGATCRAWSHSGSQWFSFLPGRLQPSWNAACHVSQPPRRRGGTWHAR